MWAPISPKEIKQEEIFITLNLGIRPTLKKRMCPDSILVQSTTVDAMFSGEGPSHKTPSTLTSKFDLLLIWLKVGAAVPLVFDKTE